MRVLTLPLLILLMACTGVDTEQLTTEFSVLKSIECDSLCSSLDVVSGDNIVFKYERTSEDDLGFADDEFFEELLFEIAPIQSDSFRLQDSLFSKHRLVYRNICFGTCTGDYVTIEGGEISGSRVDSFQWNITIDVEFNLGRRVIPIRIEEPFTKAEF